ncbi:G2/mitotic-specific cyclin S13-6 [Glycine max]|nr:G2/mitotic-specific cyclin S13-6 [Glycine max]
MRAILFDWLILVHTKFNLLLETLYLTINIVDRFLAVKNVPKRELQLIDISALLMATKYEEIYPPQAFSMSVKGITLVLDCKLVTLAYTHEQILVMEKIILAKLEWTLTMPIPLVFLLRFIKASVPDQEVNELVRLTDYTHEQVLVMEKTIMGKLENMAHFLSELGMMHYATIKYFPSMVAASAVFAARCALNKAPLWNETLKLHSGYSQEQLMHVNMNWDCARLLVSFHSTVANREEKVVYLKYSDPEKGVVAMLPPAKNLLPEGEAVVGGGKQQKKNGVADGRNRKALGDIGNLANIRSAVEVKPNRPITRSFGAQLLANAQAAAAAGNNKKQACANVAGPPAVANGGVAVAKRVAPKPGPKKVTVTVKPKPEEVIDIEASPDKKEVLKDKKNEGDANSKKKSQHTLTSVLTARSKAACGITNKPKEQIIDIDASDVDNELAAVEYIDDIYKFYKLVENESHPHDYIDSQPEINERMRAILVDWLIDVHTKFELSLETLYLTINIIDRFLAVKTVPRRELQLVGISAMLMASKYEEIWPPEVNDFVCLSDRAYTHEQILAMEKTILNKLEWTLTVPTPFVFLVRFIKAAVPDQELENMAHFMSELGMMNYATLMYCPSMVAASAVFAARCTLNKAPLWNETLKLHTGYSQEQLMDCARLLVGFHSTLGNGKLRVVYRKYSDPQKGAVAVLPPAKLLPEGSASQHS